MNTNKTRLSVDSGECDKRVHDDLGEHVDMQRRWQSSFDCTDRLEGHSHTGATRAPQHACSADAGSAAGLLLDDNVDAPDVSDSAEAYRPRAGSALGTPFVVDGFARTAEVGVGGDWLASGVCPWTDGLNADACRALAEHWTRAALLEHAGVAAFARLIMQLMSLGAPPDLIDEAQVAMGDKTAHAKLCFALASAYAGSNVQPRRLNINRALSGDSPLDVLRVVIREGCIGETLGAVEAAEGRSSATDTVVKQVLSRIHDDETRHAELAWRTVKWAIGAGLTTPAEMERELQAAVEQSAAETADMAHMEGRRDLASHGLLSPATTAEVRRVALQSVVRPAADALTGSPSLPSYGRVVRALA